LNPLTRTVHAGYRDSVAFIGAAQSGKSNALTRVALDLGGALFTASTRGALAVDTMIARSKMGPVWLADPSGEGGFPTNLICSPLSGCRSHQVAADSAGEIMHAVPVDAHKTGAWWRRQAAVLLKLMMHAGALEPSVTMLDVQAWIEDRDLWEIPVRILARSPHAAPGWADSLTKMLVRADRDGEYFTGLVNEAAGALEWLNDPAMQRIAGGPPGEDGELSPEDFLLHRGTLHLVAANKPHNSVAPYFAWLLSYVFNAGKRIAATRPGRILNPPCAIMLDEPRASCPVDLARYLIEAAGWGFPFTAGFQSISQLAEACGEAGAKTVSNNFTWQVYLGGTQEPDHLERMSAMGGDEDTRHHKTREPGTRRTFTPGRLNHLQQGEVFVKGRALRGFTGRIPPASEHPLYEPAGPGTWPVEAREPVRVSQRPALARSQRGAIAQVLLYLTLVRPVRPPKAPLAIEPLRRGAIPMPGAPPFRPGHLERLRTPGPVPVLTGTIALEEAGALQ
jgi:hypothetical protein